jgi:hypothetical protein
MHNVGFMKKGLEIAENNPAFISPYMDLPEYQKYIDLFVAGNNILTKIDGIKEEWNQIVRSAGIRAFHRYKILYGCVREMANKI